MSNKTLPLYFPVILLVLLLPACRPAGDSTPAASPPPMEPPAGHVFILSLDGLRPDAISLAPMPTLLALMEDGAYTLNARTIFPGSTLPAHTSMLTGLCPAQHGVTWNKYRPEKGYAEGIDLFDLAHAAGLETSMFVGKEKLRQVTQIESTDSFEYVKGNDSLIMEQALEGLPQGFGVMFIHFPSGDRAGHDYGWLSDEQLDVFRQADAALAEFLAVLDDLGLRSDTLVIVTADHGGHRKGHGSWRAEDLDIPWVIAGPGVVHARLSTAVHITDTAATAAWALGLPLPPEWAGKPVTEAFGLPILPRPQGICR